MASFDYTFTSGDTVTPTKLNSARNVKDIVNADIKSDAAIALSKLATGALPAAITVASDNLVDGTIVNADINASAAIAGTKVAPNFGGQNVATTGNGSFAQVLSAGNDPHIQLSETDASANNQKWDIMAANEALFVRAVNDAYSVAGNAIEIQRSGTTIDSVSMPNGNVVIGANSSTSKLTVVDNSANDAVRITQTGSGNALVVEDSANPDATPFVVTADGSVRLGASSANAKLQFDNAVAANGYDANKIRLYDDGTIVYGLGIAPFELGYRAEQHVFYSGAVTPAERLRIGSSGNVGINTAIPTERLEVGGTVKATAFSGPLTGNVTGNLTGTASAIADGSVSTAKIVDANVTNAKLASDIDASKITTGTLPIDRIADDAVTNAKLSLAANAGEIKKALNADNSPPIFACRAWVNFDGTRNEADTGASTNSANVKIFSSGNVASVLKNSTGTYTVTFTTAMPDANYAAVGSVDQASHASVPEFGTTKTSSAFSVVTPTVTAISGDNRTLADSNNVSVAIFR
jgi:hypothetical protein